MFRHTKMSACDILRRNGNGLSEIYTMQIIHKLIINKDVLAKYL